MSASVFYVNHSSVFLLICCFGGILWFKCVALSCLVCKLLHLCFKPFGFHQLRLQRPYNYAAHTIFFTAHTYSEYKLHFLATLFYAYIDCKGSRNLNQSTPKTFRLNTVLFVQVQQPVQYQ